MKSKKSLLKWKKPYPGHQATHCGQYWVEQDPEGGHFNRWHAHRKDIDEQLTFDGFDSREEAKQYCEQDANEEKAKEPVLPVALRDTQITKKDVETMLRVATDMIAQKTIPPAPKSKVREGKPGHYRRKPKKVKQA